MHLAAWLIQTSLRLSGHPATLLHSQLLFWQAIPFTTQILFEGFSTVGLIALSAWLLRQRSRSTSLPRRQPPPELPLTGLMRCRIHPDGLWEVIDVSQDCATILHYSIHDLLTSSGLWQSWIDPVIWDTVFRSLPQQLPTTTTQDLEYRFHQGNHQFCWLRTRVVAAQAEANGTWSVTLIHSPIRDRPPCESPSLIEHSLRQELAFRNQIIDHMAEGLCVCHMIPNPPHIHFTIWSQRMVELTGYTQEHINRVGWYQAVYPDPERQAQAIARMAAMRQGHDLREEEWEITRADGQTRLFAISTSLLPCDDTEPHVLALMRDITEAKAVKSAFRLSENKTHALIQALPDLILRMNRQGVYLDFFPTTTFKVLGGDFLIGCDVYEGHLPPAIAAMRMHYIHAALDTGELQIYEQQFVIDGTLQIEEVRIVVCGPDEVLVIVRDMTQRKQIEAELQSSEERLRAILDSSPYGIFLKNMEGRYTYVNPACETLSQISHDQLLGRRDEEILPPDLVAICTSSDAAALTSGHAVTCEETVPLGGRSRTLLMTKFLLHDAHNRPNALCGIAVDISDRKRTEAALRENEQFLRSIYNYAQNSIFIVDVLPDGDFRYVSLNPIHERLTGLSSETLRGKPPEAVLPPELAAQVRQHYRDCVAAKTVIEYEEYFPLQGRAVWWLTSLAPIADDAGRVYRIVGTSTDISNLKIAEHQLQSRADREIVLNCVTQTIRRSLDLGEIFDVAVTEVARTLAVEQVNIFQLRPQHSHWYCVAEFLQSPELPNSLGLAIEDAVVPFRKG